jgi:two-component system response regulator HydG
LPETILTATGTEFVEASPEAPAVLTSSAEVNDGEDEDDRVDVSASGADDGDDEITVNVADVIPGELDFNAQKETFEKEFIIKALKTFKGRINQTALHANIPKKTLLRKIEKYGIKAKDFAG